MKVNVNKPAYVLVFSAAVSAAFTAAIMTLHALTAGAAERNARLYEQRSVVEVFGLGGAGRMTDEQVLRTYGRRVRQLDVPLRDPQTGTGFNDPGGGAGAAKTLVARDADGRLLGYALPVWGIGFWARIDGYLAVTPDLKKVIGIVFLRHSETPGLGGRITEPAWRKQFRGLNVAPPAGGGRYIYIGGERPGSQGSGRFGRHVDAITGATGTSAAVERFLNERLAEFDRAAKAAGLGQDRPEGARWRSRANASS